MRARTAMRLRQPKNDLRCGRVGLLPCSSACADIYASPLCDLDTSMCRPPSIGCAGRQLSRLHSLVQFNSIYSLFCTFNSSLAFLYTRLVPRQTALYHAAPSCLPNVAQTYEADIVGYARSLSPRLLNWPGNKAGKFGHQWHYFVRHLSELG